jgi:hypothetical protein
MQVQTHGRDGGIRFWFLGARAGFFGFGSWREGGSKRLDVFGAGAGPKEISVLCSVCRVHRGPGDPRTAARKRQTAAAAAAAAAGSSRVPIAIAKELRTNRTGGQIRDRFMALGSRRGLNKASQPPPPPLPLAVVLPCLILIHAHARCWANAPRTAEEWWPGVGPRPLPPLRPQLTGWQVPAFLTGWQVPPLLCIRSPHKKFVQASS